MSFTFSAVGDRQQGSSILPLTQPRQSRVTSALIAIGEKNEFECKQAINVIEGHFLLRGRLLWESCRDEIRNTFIRVYTFEHSPLK